VRDRRDCIRSPKRRKPRQRWHAAGLLIDGRNVEAAIHGNHTYTLAISRAIIFFAKPPFTDGDAGMNARVKPITSPVAVTDPKIRRELQLAGLRFAISRARWFIDEAKLLGKALKDGKISMDEADAKLADMGALDLLYPELMGRTQ
jgi:hypothetical protein